MSAHNERIVQPPFLPPPGNIPIRSLTSGKRSLPSNSLLQTLTLFLSRSTSLFRVLLMDRKKVRL